MYAALPISALEPTPSIQNVSSPRFKYMFFSNDIDIAASIEDLSGLLSEAA